MFSLLVSFSREAAVPEGKRSCAEVEVDQVEYPIPAMPVFSSCFLKDITDQVFMCNLLWMKRVLKDCNMLFWAYYGCDLCVCNGQHMKF